MLKIGRAIYDSFNGELESRVEAFKLAKEQHHMTVDLPAPTEDPLVERLAVSGEDFTIEEMEKNDQELPPQAITISKTQLILALKRGELITAKEAMDAATAGKIPAILEAEFDGKTEDEEFELRFRWASAAMVSENDVLGKVIKKLTESDEHFFGRASSI